MCTCYELTCSFCGQPVDDCTCWTVDPDPEPDPDPDWDIYCPTCGFAICQCCPRCHAYPCDCEPDGGDGTDTDEGEYEDTDQGGGGNPPSFDNTPLTSENFLDKIISTRLMVKFPKYNINYKSIKLVVDTKTIRNQTNAAFDATNNTMTIYNNMFASNFTRTDMESILFHEFIHYRDFVNKGDLPRNVDGYVVKKTYMVHCTPFELEWTYNSCMKDAISSNLPLTDRTPEQEALWNMIFVPYNGLKKLYEDGTLYEVDLCKEQIEREITAYTLQLSEYESIMSPQLRTVQQKNLSHNQFVWEDLQLDINKNK